MLSTNKKAKKSVYINLNPRPLGLWAAALPTALICSTLAFLPAVVLPLAVTLPLAFAVFVASSFVKLLQ